jgi:Plant transposon protein
MHIIWKYCPSAWKGKFHNPKDSKLAVLIVEAWCDHDLYVWSWFAGRAGTNNDITVANASPLFNDIMTGSWCTDFEYNIEDKRNVPYFLVNGIYPAWTIFASPIHVPSSVHEVEYTKRQEQVRKDVERCVRVLQTRFNVRRVERKQWNEEDTIVDGQER